MKQTLIIRTSNKVIDGFECINKLKKVSNNATYYYYHGWGEVEAANYFIRKVIDDHNTLNLKDLLAALGFDMIAAPTQN